MTIGIGYWFDFCLQKNIINHKYYENNNQF